MRQSPNIVSFVYTDVLYAPLILLIRVSKNDIYLFISVSNVNLMIEFASNASFTFMIKSNFGTITHMSSTYLT